MFLLNLSILLGVKTSHSFIKNHYVAYLHKDNPWTFHMNKLDEHTDKDNEISLLGKNPLES